MNKILRYSFVALLAMVFGNVMASESVDFTAQGYENAAEVASYEGTDFTITFAGNGASNSPKWYNTGTAIRMYAKNSMTITSSKTIIGIKFTLGSDGPINENNEGFSTGTYDRDNTMWTGSTTELTLTNAAKSGNQIRLQKLDVYFEGETLPGGEITVAAPTIDGLTPFSGSTQVTITNNEAGASVYYTTDGNDPTASSTVYVSPFTITETTTVKAIAIKDEASSSVASKTFTAVSSVANIAALNALENGSVFAFAGEALVVYVNGRYAYIKDETGSSLIFDNGTTKLANLAVGKKVAANWTGKVSIYNNLFEVVPDAELAVTDAAAVEVTYPEAAITDVIATNMNQVVVIKDVTYTAPEEGSKNFTITKGETTLNGYNQFGLEIAAPAEDKTYDITGVISVYKENVQFQPIAIAEAAVETKYTITITNTEHGSLTLDKYEAAAGEKVNVIGMSVDDGYEMNEPTITAESGAAVEIGGNDEEGHYLIMPASNVTIALNISKLYTITTVFNSEQGDVRGISFDSEKSPILKGAGKNVKFTVTAKQGFKVESVTAACEDNTPITVNVAADNSYYEFQMPAKNVTITATFSPVSGISNITAAKAENAVRYNVAGQVVNKGYKGLVIVNGQKFVQK